MMAILTGVRWYLAYYQLLVGAYAYFVLSIPEQFLLSISDFQNASNEFFELFFNDTATTEIYTLSLHDALPILLGM